MKLLIEPTNVDELQRLFPGSRGLWIGSGASSGKLLQKNKRWFSRYDFVVVSNGAHESFEWLAGNSAPAWIWICIESTGCRFPWFYRVNKAAYPIQLAHHRNWELANQKKVAKFMDKLMIKVNRNKHGEKFVPREYDLGFHSGPVQKSNVAAGTVTLQVMHLAAYMGAAHLDMCGVEFCAVNDEWHFYEDLHSSLDRYKKEHTDELSEHVVRVELDGKWWWTHTHFLESPPYIDYVYRKFIEPAGMTCARFCSSLIKEIPKVAMPK